jgi:hypothetical protein
MACTYCISVAAQPIVCFASLTCLRELPSCELTPASLSAVYSTRTPYSAFVM